LPVRQFLKGINTHAKFDQVQHKAGLMLDTDQRVENFGTARQCDALSPA